MTSVRGLSVLCLAAAIVAGTGTRAAAQTEPRPPSPTATAPHGDVALTLAPFDVPRYLPRASTTAVAIVIGVRQPPPTDSRDEKIGVLVRVFTHNGRPVTASHHRVDLSVIDKKGEVAYEVLSRVDLKPGRYIFRVSVGTGSHGKIGETEQAVTVPDFRDHLLSLSGLVMTASPSVRAAMTPQIKELIPVQPTASRSFTSGQVATAFVRLYQGGTRPAVPVRVTATVTNAKGKQVHIEEKAIAAEAFAAYRAADHVVVLPIARIPADEYQLTIMATTGKATTAPAQARFTVR